MFDADVDTHEVDHLVEEVGSVSLDCGGEVSKLVHDRQQRHDRTGEVDDPVLGVGGTGRAAEAPGDDDTWRVDVLGVGDAVDDVVEKVGGQGPARHPVLAEVLAGIDERLFAGAVDVGRRTCGDVGDQIARRHPISPFTPLVNERPEPPKERPALWPAPKAPEDVSTQDEPPERWMPCARR